MWVDKRLTLKNIEEILDRPKHSVDSKAANLGLDNRGLIEAQWEMEANLERYREVVDG